MRAIRLFASLCLLASAAMPAAADIAVIVNASNAVRQMNNDQLADLYLGRTRVFPDGEYALVLDLGKDIPLRERFMNALTGMNARQVNSYWSRMMFTGQVLPPQQLPDEKTVLNTVKRNPGAIGYVRAPLADPSVRTIMTLKE